MDYEDNNAQVHDDGSGTSMDAHADHDHEVQLQEVCLNPVSFYSYPLFFTVHVCIFILIKEFILYHFYFMNSLR